MADPTYEELNELKVDELIGYYIMVRDKKAEVSAELKTKEAKFEKRLELLKTVIIDKAKEVGTDQFKVKDIGTASIVTKRKFVSADWNSYGRWIWNEAIKHGDRGWEYMLMFLQKRVLQSGIEKYMEENNGIVPDGLNVTAEMDIMVRRAS